MSVDVKKVSDDLTNFWNNAICLTNDVKEELKKLNNDYHTLAPSEKLYLAIKELGNCNKVLDYGCGSGWASIISVKSGCNDVLAVDLGENIIDTANFYSELYGVNNVLKTKVIDTDWLKNENNNTYDGIVCSNVLDVIPLDVSKAIISELARIACKGARVIIGLNFYMDSNMAKQRNMELVDDKYLFVNGILRLTSLSDSEWQQAFLPFFDIERLEYFAWPGETKESRRLFVLRRK